MKPKEKVRESYVGQATGADEDLVYLTLQDDVVFLKIARACNNRCLFCCDTVFQDGGLMDSELVRDTIRKGAEAGLPVMFISGGEPTIHPDFINFIKYGKELGFEKIQAITNGRMFAYESFARRAVAAGLDELVFSINSADAGTHDLLVGCRGAFAQAMAGMENVRKTEKCVVHVNVLITAMNHEEMPLMPAFFKGLGVHTVNFILVAPTGRGYPDNWARLSPDLGGVYPVFRETIARANAEGVRLKLKKFPDNFFEGNEDMLEDPDERFREIREIHRRRGLFVPNLDRAETPPCWNTCCPQCFIEPFCRFYEGFVTDFIRGGFGRVELSAAGLPVFSALKKTKKEMIERAKIILRAVDAKGLKELAAAVEGAAVIVRLDDEGGFSPADVVGLNVERVALRSVAAIEAFLDGSEAEVEILLNTATAGWIEQNIEKARTHRARLILGMENFDSLGAARAGTADLRSLGDGARALALRSESLPPCLCAGAAHANERTLNLDVLLDEKTLDVEKFAAWHVREHDFTKSRRCAECRHDSTCGGVHVNYARAHGYGTLRPVAKQP